MDGLNIMLPGRTVTAKSPGQSGLGMTGNEEKPFAGESRTKHKETGRP